LTLNFPPNLVTQLWKFRWTQQCASPYKWIVKRQLWLQNKRIICFTRGDYIAKYSQLNIDFYASWSVFPLLEKSFSLLTFYCLYDIPFSVENCKVEYCEESTDGQKYELEYMLLHWRKQSELPWNLRES
jgi:hypothetical protein